MTDEPTLLGRLEQTTAQRRRRRPNGWELALWVLGVVLLVASYLSAQLVVAQLFSSTDSGNGEADLAARGTVELLYTLLPGLFTAALFCFIGAIGLRAHEANVARRPVIVAPTTTSRPEQPTSSEAPASPASPESLESPVVDRRQERQTPTAEDDYSRFMRPPADAG